MSEIATLVSATEQRAAAGVAGIMAETKSNTFDLAVELFHITQSTEDGGLGLSLAKVAGLVAIERARLDFPEATEDGLAIVAEQDSYKFSKSSADRYVGAVRTVNEACVDLNPTSVDLALKGRRSGTSDQWGVLIRDSRLVDYREREEFFNHGARVIIATWNAANAAKKSAGSSRTAGQAATDDDGADVTEPAAPVGITVEQVLATFAATAVHQWTDAERETIMTGIYGLVGTLDAQETAAKAHATV
ncbi:MAG: hypothetical protein JWO15_3918 [Sphingomonadales bacterium]|nr:hypothetical protein [Sphingomonadales bacterium]